MLDGFRLEYAFLAILFVLIHFLMEPVRWAIYVDSNRNKFQTTRDFFHVFNITALISYLMPAKLGLPLRIFLVRKIIALDYYEISSIILIDALIYYGCWALAGIVSGLIVLGHIDYSQARILILGGLIVFIILIIYLSGRAFYYKSQNNIITKITNAVLLLRKNIADKTNIKTYMFSAIVVSVDISGQGFRHFAILELIGDHLPFVTIFFISLLSISVGIFSLTPMGIGGYDATLVLLLVSYNIPLSAAAGVVLANRILSIAVAIALGGASSLFGNIKIADLLRRKTELENLNVSVTPKD